MVFFLRATKAFIAIRVYKKIFALNLLHVVDEIFRMKMQGLVLVFFALLL